MPFPYWQWISFLFRFRPLTACYAIWRPAKSSQVSDKKLSTINCACWMGRAGPGPRLGILLVRHFRRFRPLPLQPPTVAHNPSMKMGTSKKVGFFMPIYICCVLFFPLHHGPSNSSHFRWLHHHIVFLTTCNNPLLPGRRILRQFDISLLCVIVHKLLSHVYDLPSSCDALLVCTFHTSVQLTYTRSWCSNATRSNSLIKWTVSFSSPHST